MDSAKQALQNIRNRGVSQYVDLGKSNKRRCHEVETDDEEGEDDRDQAHELPPAPSAQVPSFFGSSSHSPPLRLEISLSHSWGSVSQGLFARGHSFPKGCLLLLLSGSPPRCLYLGFLPRSELQSLLGRPKLLPHHLLGSPKFEGFLFRPLVWFLPRPLSRQ